MATASITEKQPRAVPLAEADATALEAILNEQCDEWLALLRWDYTWASRLIREAASRRELNGFVATINNSVVGFAYYILEGDRCSIGDIYVSKRWRGSSADRVMLEAILDDLPRVSRIESQCVSIGNYGADELFRSRRFRRFDRYYMLVSPLPVSECSQIPTISIRNWKEEDFAQSVRIIRNSHRGEDDSRINSQYRSEEGCAELLSILTDTRWCGEFLPEASQVAICQRTGNAVGVLIASRIAAGVAHIGQISVLPPYQGKGIGRRLILASFQELAKRNFSSASLAVTSTNISALHLYRSCGFTCIHTFPVYYREQQ
jgi:ribosomal protein S18 acetylase RimI-like enzyme